MGKEKKKKMSDEGNEGPDLNGLRKKVDALAARLVVADAGPAPDDCLEEMDSIRLLAGRQGNHELSRTASELSARALSAQDPAGVLAEGIACLQQALEEPEAPAPAAKGTQLGDDPELIADFVLEAREHLDTIETRLPALEKDAGNMEAVHAVFRSFHTIKGLAGFLGLERVQQVSHEVETLLDLARQSALTITPEVADVVLAGMDYLRQWVRHLETGTTASAPAKLNENGELLRRIQAVRDPARAPGQDADTALAGPPPSGQAEAAGAALSKPPEEKRTIQPAVQARFVKVGTEKLDFLVDMVGELVIAQSLVTYDPDLQVANKPRLARNLSQLARITGDVQRTAMAMRMVEIGTLFQKMTRLVRDLARKFGKQVVLETAGDQVEVDRQIVEELADPLMHMVRNAVDHGVETPEGRLAAGKDPVAHISLRAYHKSGQIMVEIADDGRGLDRAKILEKGINKGLVAPGANLSDTECFNLIFQPGFSTAAELSNISGRGVGMDVVRKQILKLRGSIDIHSEAGRGSTFLLKLPLTLAIIEGLIVGVGQEQFIIPIFSVRELLRPMPEMLSSVEGVNEMVLVRENLLPLVRLHERFSIEPSSREPGDGVLVVSETNGKEYVLLVDRLIGKREVVIKSLGPTFRNASGIAGGAILGDGHVGLILDMAGLYGGGGR